MWSFYHGLINGASDCCFSCDDVHRTTSTPHILTLKRLDLRSFSEVENAQFVRYTNRMTPEQKYIEEIAFQFESTRSSEYSYRAQLQNYLTFIFPREKGYRILHDPKAVDQNKPDFVIEKNDVAVLHIEAKDLTEKVSLDKVENSEQMSRYYGYDNLILTDYLEFRFYRFGERGESKYAQPIKLASADFKKRKVTQYKDRFSLLGQTIVDFTHSHKEPIKYGSQLARIMGGKAQRIRMNTLMMLEKGSEGNTELHKIREAVKERLLASMTDAEFADMYAQTLVYGLFAARYHDKTPDNFSRAEARELIAATNPFLQHFFDHITGASFPKRLQSVVDELCEVFAHADIQKLLTDFYKNDKEKDPVIHFYEDFLREYDAGKKMDMGVFYTPKPVVQFIVKGVDTLLKREFGLTKGLTDTSTITVASSSADGKKKKESQTYHRVQVLDFATGTGTFLNETIEFIHGTFHDNKGAWASYAKEHLLPRLHGFELMMASYTIAHLKLGMTLQHYGVQLSAGNRLGVYLTNTLDAPSDYSTQGTLFGLLDALSEESKSASRIKAEVPIMCIIGNPPYSGESMNPHYTDNSVYKVEPGGKEKLKEKNSKWINDDYVKFIRFAESMVEKNGEGVIAMITAHGYIDNPTFRGMRWHLRSTFGALYVLDLHGNSNKKETTPDGRKDENVFDIKTGVSILFGIKKKSSEKGKKLAKVFQADLYGGRKEKFAKLDMGFEAIQWNELPENADVWRIEGENREEYMQGFSVAELFPVNSVGIVTARDSMSIQFTKEDIEKVVSDFETEDVEILRTKYELGKDVRDWSVQGAKIDVLKNDGIVTKIAYRPFDTRYTYYTGRSKGFHCMPRGEVMKHLVKRDNLSLVFVQRSPQQTPASYVFVSKNIGVNGSIRSDSVSIDTFAPLYVFENGEKITNFHQEINKKITATTGDARPEEIFDYVYAVLHSPSYRTRYNEFLKSDFPRVPYPKNKDTFFKLAALGEQLRKLHLEEDTSLAVTATFPQEGTNTVDAVKRVGEQVHINSVQCFDNVPDVAWNFYIGGYQPAQKYLKDRKGRVLTYDEIEHYRTIIAILIKTDQLMKEIDTIVDF